MYIRSLWKSVQVSLCTEQLCHQNSAASGAAQRIMRETDKLDVVLGIRAQAADRNGHTVLQIAIQAGLRTVILAEIMQELLRPDTCKPTP